MVCVIMSPNKGVSMREAIENNTIDKREHMM